MKSFLRFSVFLSSLALAAAVFAGPPVLTVMVADASGKVAYKGKTAANGTFATAALQPGEYTVQFNGAVRGECELVISAGKQKVVSGSVAGSKFGGGGVAMRIKVGKGLNITGQVMPAGSSATAATAAGGAKVRIINGKRYVWVGPETGSHMGGRWVEEGSVTASGVVKGGAGVLTGLQDKGAQGSVPGN